MENQRGAQNASTNPPYTNPPYTNPPYKCGRTQEEDICLRFYRNPANGLYDLPPGGERVNCTECLYFFE
jgi:hypothetical protein